jgi:hypothetical protein
MRPGDGSDSVIDFDVQNDLLDLSAFGFSFDQIRTNTAQFGDLTRISLGGWDNVTLTNVQPADLHPSMFIL